MVKLLHLTVFILAIGLSSCQFYSKVEPPKLSVNQEYLTSIPVEFSNPSEPFFSQFEDEALVAILKEVIDNNFELLSAIERISEAESLYNVTRSKSFPQIDLGLDAQRTRSSQSGFSEIQGTPFALGVGSNKSIVTNIFLQAFNASWEIDFFGKIRNQKKRASAFIEEIKASKKSVELTLVNDTAISYFAICAYNDLERLEIKRQKLLDNLKCLKQDSNQKGLLSDQELYKIDQRKNQSEKIALEYQKNHQIFYHHLATLLGKEATELNFQPKPLKPLNLDKLFCNVKLPVEALEARPDFVIAKEQLIQSGYSVKVAKAELFPSISLLGAFGFADNLFPSWFTKANSFWAVGPTLRWPVFDGFKNLSTLKAEQSKEKQAVLNYQLTLLKALEDVENSLVIFLNQQKTALLANQNFNAQVEIDRLNLSLWQSGIKAFETLIEDELLETEKQQAVVLEEFKTRQALLNLYKALGGTWQ